MGEVHYMISEAAKRVNVETHVLRYWEEELSLSIGRTEMGHRYYTDCLLYTSPVHSDNRHANICILLFHCRRTRCIIYKFHLQF